VKSSRAGFPSYQRWGILIALCLVSPALWLGLQLDDFFHWSLVSQQELLPPTSDKAGVFGLFSFLDGQADRTYQLMNLGMVPWWTLDSVQYAFWRPVAEITHGIDYALLSQWPALMHIHGFFYFALLLYFAAKLFEDIHGDAFSLPASADSGLGVASGPAITLWAFWIFVLSYTHGLPAAWLANRNAVLATLFVVLTLRAHHRWRQNEAPLSLGFGLLFFLAGLLSGELAVSAGLYLFSYALFLDKGTFIRRMLSITPYAVLGMVWLVSRAAMEYGAKNSGHYIDPGNDIGLFFQVFGERAISLLSAQFFSLPPELLAVVPTTPKLVLQIVLLLLLAVAIIPLVVADKRARFWLVGLLLCVLPVCATIPHSRLLMCVSLGAAGLLGLLLAKWRVSWVAGNKQWVMMPLVALLLLAQFVISPLLLPVEAASIRLAMDGALNTGARNLPITEANKNNAAVIINPPMSSVAGYINGVRLFEGLPVARQTIPLVSGRQGIELVVVDSHTVEITAEKGFYDAHNEGLLRDPNQGFAAMDTIELAMMRVAVQEVSDAGVPTTVRFAFLQPLNSDSIDFYIWAAGHPVLCQLPAVGERIHLETKTASCI